MKLSPKSLLIPGVYGISLLSGCSTGESSKNTEKLDPPNILLIMADDVDPLHLSCYGGKIPTPHLDLLAGRGVLFERAYASAAVCTPSRYATITGRFPGQCTSDEFTETFGEDDIYSIQFNTPINDQSYTLQKMLNQAGYFTGYTGKFHIGELEYDNPESNPEIPYIEPNKEPGSPQADAGLKKYQQIISQRVKELTGADFVSAINWENPEEIPVKKVAAHHLEWLTQGATAFVDTAIMQEKPFFLHFNTTALHGPNHYFDLLKRAEYTPSGDLKNPYEFHPDRKEIFQRLDSLGLPNNPESVEDHILHYQNGIIYMDDQVGALLKYLEDKGVLENTMVIFTADHSTEPGKNTCYEKGLRVPFIVSGPQVATPGQKTDALVSFVDFMPTFADMAKYTIPDSIRLAGQSFHPILKNEPYSRKAVYAEIGYLRAVSTDSFKYIAQRFPEDVITTLQNAKEPEISHLGNKAGGFASIAMEYHPGYFDADQLYNLHEDPYEQNNLAKNPAYDKKLDEMQDLLSTYLSEIGYYYPLADTAYVQLPAYKEAVKNARQVGTSNIPWWNRKLDYPPSKNKSFYY